MPVSDEEIARKLQDPRYWIERNLSIVDQFQKRVPFLLNPVQSDYMSNRTRDDDIVKARKMGFSALITAVWLHACQFQENTRAVVISHDKDATKRLFRRVKDYIKYSKIPIVTKKESEEELSFPGTNSWFYIGTAGSRAFGRGDDITHLHFSEPAHYRDQSVITSAQEALIKGGAWCVKETTALGAGTPFHESWLKAIDKDKPGKGHFYGWWQDKLNFIESSPFELTVEEKKLKRAFDLTWGQLAWRRHKLESMDNPALFPQEHPATWEEAFLASGLMVFDWEGVLRQEKAKIEPKWRGHIIDDGKQVVVENDPKGPFEVYRSYDPRTQYLIVCDAAEGVVGGAFSIADVYDLRTWEQVAQWRGHADPLEFGDISMRIGALYGWALIACEYNTPGNAVCTRMESADYPNIYIDPDNPGDNVGFLTTTKSKPIYISDGRTAIKDGSLKVNSEHTINEMRTFVLGENGIMGPQKGCFQDTVITSCKAANILKHFRYEPEARKKSFREVMGAPKRNSRRPGQSGRRYSRGIV